MERGRPDSLQEPKGITKKGIGNLWNVYPSKNGIQEIRLASWKEFVEVSSKLFSVGPAFVVRSQANYDWPLVSTHDRLENRYANAKTSIPRDIDRKPIQRFPRRHIQRLLVGRDGDAVGTVYVLLRQHPRHLAVGIDAINRFHVHFQFVPPVGGVARVGEPNASLGIDANIVGTVVAFAIVFLRQDG